MPVCRRSSLFLRKANIPSPLVLQKYLVIQKKNTEKKYLFLLIQRAYRIWLSLALY